jgi:hypothetical protein
MASLLDEWAVQASDPGGGGGDPRALSPLDGGGGLGGGLGGATSTTAAIGFSDEEDEQAAPGSALPAFLGQRPAPAEPDIFALDPVEREVTRCACVGAWGRAEGERGR